jgi:hypothetical protein
MKKFFILLAILFSLQVANAKIYVVIASMHRIEGDGSSSGKTCYSVEIKFYENNNTATPTDDVYLGKTYARVCTDGSTDGYDNHFGSSTVPVSNETLKLVEIKVYPNPISSNEKLNVDFGNYEFENLSISPVNTSGYSPDNLIFFDDKEYKGNMSIDISKLKPGAYILNAVSMKNKIFTSVKFLVK